MLTQIKLTLRDAMLARRRLACNKHLMYMSDKRILVEGKNLRVYGQAEAKIILEGEDAFFKYPIYLTVELIKKSW